MTAHRDVWLACDGPGPGDRCGAQYPEDAGDSAFIDATVPEVRAAAKADGWYSHAGKDKCPEHAPTTHHADPEDYPRSGVEFGSGRR